MTSEVLIIGGGVIGLSIARELHKNGVREIAILDKGALGEESSWAAAGMLGPQSEAEDLGMFFQMCSESRDLYPEFADELLAETGVDIELDRTGTLYVAFDDDEAAELRERIARQRAAGLDIEELSSADLLRLEPNLSPAVKMGSLFAGDWQVENRMLLAALRRYAELNGIAIHERTEISDILVENGKATGARTVGGDTFTAECVIIATGAWTSLIKVETSPPAFKVEPVRGQIIAYHPAEPMLRHVVCSHAGYIVPRQDGRILAGSTSERVGFEKSVTESAGSDLSEMASRILPALSSLEIADHWAGLRPFAADGLPVIGAIDGLTNLFVATAHYRNGILLAPLTAKLTADAVLGNPVPEYLKEFGPERFKIRGLSHGV